MRQILGKGGRAARYRQVAAIDGNDQGSQKIGIRRNSVKARPRSRHEARRFSAASARGMASGVPTCSHNPSCTRP